MSGEAYPSYLLPLLGLYYWSKELFKASILEKGTHLFDFLLSLNQFKGMNVARLNICHGTRDTHAQSITNLRELLVANPEHHCALLLDVSGEVRVGRLKNKKQILSAGAEVSICCDPLVEGDYKTISLDYTNIHDVVKYVSSCHLCHVFYHLLIQILGPAHRLS